MSHKPEPIFLDAVVRVDKLHPPGRDIAVTADADGLVRLAEILKVSSVESFSATAVASPFRGGLRVLGRVKTRIVQPSVVSFEAVTQNIDEVVDRIFMPDTAKPRNAASGPEIFVDLDEDAPDTLDGPELDVTDLLIETAALAIDPYPRLSGETIESLGVKLIEDDPSPFSSLKSLKNPSQKP